MDIGNVTLSAINTFKIGDIQSPNEAVQGMGVRGYILAEFKQNLPSVELSGYLLQLYGGSRTLQQFREDVLAIQERRAAYNYVSNVKGRSGWISCTNIDVDDEVGELWPLAIQGTWFDASQYKEEYTSNPVTMANNFSITGTYDQDAVEAADDVQCFDGSPEVFSIHHSFSGNCTIKNGLYQIILSENTISIYYYDSGYVKIDDFTAGTFDTITLLELNEDICTVKTDNSIEISLERGRIPYINSPVDLECSLLSPSDQSTSTDNYLELDTGLYVASNVSFSIASSVIDAGKMWIFYAASDVSTTAHDAIVESNLKRRVVIR